MMCYHDKIFDFIMMFDHDFTSNTKYFVFHHRNEMKLINKIEDFIY